MSFTQSLRRVITIALALGAVSSFGTPAAAQSDSSMKKDPRKMDATAKDGMMKDAMGSDAMAKDAMMTTVPHSLNLDRRGLALHGYDPVAYFTVSKPVRGKGEYTATHAGATYRFASTSNRDAFTANPDSYAPQFGGYCAMGVALNKKLDVDPAAWRIVDGKLYLNLNKNVQREWKQDIPGNISKAVRNWPAIRGIAAKDL